MKRSEKLLNFIFIITFFILFFSCSNNTKEQKLFPEEKNIVFNNMNIGENLGRIWSIKSIDNYLVAVDKNVDTQLQLIDKKTKMNYLFGQSGEGPGRLLQGSDIMPIDNRHIGVYDIQKRTLFDFNIDSIVKLDIKTQPEVLIREVPSFPLAVDRLNENTYVALGLMSGMNRFTLLNGSGEIISMHGYLPEKKQKEISDFVHAFAYYGKLTTNPKEHKIAICTNYAGIIQVYYCDTNDVYLIKEQNLFLADYDENNGNFAVNPQTRWGYLSIDSNDRYIFALYSGLNQVQNPDGSFLKSNIVHVYDWDGNPVCRLLLDRKLTMICIDDNGNLFGYDVEKEDIVVADIKDI